MSLKRTIYRLSFQVFKLFSRAGLYILPAHYYVPIADINRLEKTKESWAVKSSLPGVHSDLDEQAARMKDICLPFQKEYEGNHTYKTAVNEHFGSGYGYIEAQALHGFLRHLHPKRIIEVGSGISTFCMRHALKINREKSGRADHGHTAQLTGVEPHPSEKLKKMDGIHLIDKPVQLIPPETFANLDAGDFLFIDSTHTIKPGGDVNYLILEILPRLKKGVVVHFHDIFLPYDYPRNVLSSYFQWMETSLLRAFLINNSKARILFCLSQLHYGRPDVLKEVFPDYVRAPDSNGLEPDGRLQPESGHYPASIYIEISGSAESKT